MQGWHDRGHEPVPLALLISYADPPRRENSVCCASSHSVFLQQFRC
jgi:hypothetical protein